MAHSDNIRLEGTVIKVLPSSFYKVEVGTKDAPHELLCHTSGKMKMNSIVITVGDRVAIEVSPYDMSKGRIVYRLR